MLLDLADTDDDDPDTEVSKSRHTVYEAHEGIDAIGLPAPVGIIVDKRLTADTGLPQVSSEIFLTF